MLRNWEDNRRSVVALACFCHRLCGLYLLWSQSICRTRDEEMADFTHLLCCHWQDAHA